jgi:hypothetical protein
MKVEVHFHSFSSNESGPRAMATQWMVQQYKIYGDRIISSNFAEDDTSVTAYITVLSEPQEPAPEKTPVILK